jgi:starch phosphorylase
MLGEWIMADTITDPVCGMLVSGDGRYTTEYRGRRFVFCSEFCWDAFLAAPETYALSPVGGTVRADAPRRVAYFSMEVAVDAGMPTYSGGLGVLAGDTLKSAADLGLPVVAVSLLNARGYFDQSLDRSGNQHEQPVAWDPSGFVHPLPAQIVTGSDRPQAPEVEVTIEGRAVKVRGWQYDVVGATGFTVPLILLDTDVLGNDPRDRELSSHLYGGDDRYRLAQEVVLGVGGVRMLRALGHTSINRFHMNEGHAALLVLELLGTSRWPPAWDFHGTRAECVFTTHTPVLAGHDSFPYGLVHRVLGAPLPEPVVRMLGGADRLDMTHLGMSMSRYVNGVAKRHAEVTREMFPGQPIGAITNGVHSRTWTCDSFKELFDRHIPGWANDPAALRSAIGIPEGEVWEAHARAKDRLIDEVRRRAGVNLARDALTIGFARRATAYKRADLVFRDTEQLATIAREVGPVQLVFAGKAHPRDEAGKEMIRRVFAAGEQLRERVRVVYLENYDLALAALLTAGVDVWLNTPRRPLEASGTSGMKAAHNGVPSLSTLDGWWAEGHVEGVTGWSIGPVVAAPDRDADAEDAADLYRKLREVVVPLYHRDRGGWERVMRHAIALNASFFNTHRMVQQYAANAYV